MRVYRASSPHLLIADYFAINRIPQTRPKSFYGVIRLLGFLGWVKETWDLQCG